MLAFVCLLLFFHLDLWPNDQIMVSSPAILSTTYHKFSVVFTVNATAFSPESSRVELLPIICSAVGAVIIVILIIVLITIVALCMRQRKRNNGTISYS